MIWAWAFLMITAAQATRPDHQPAALQPYRVEIRLSLPREPRWNDGFVRDYTDALARLAERSLGSAWQVRTTFDHDTLVRPSQNLPNDIDKLIWISLDSSSLARDRWRGVEYDLTLHDWSAESIHDRPKTVLPVEEMFAWILELFRPTAEIVSKTRSDAQISFRAEALLPAHSRVTWNDPNTPLLVMRWNEPNGNVERLPFTYLKPKQESQPRKFACLVDIVSAYRDPLSRRSRRRITHLAIAAKPTGARLTRAVYHDRKNDKPIANVQVALRPMGEQVVVPIGVTGPDGGVDVRAPNALATSSNPGQIYDLLLRSGDVVLARVPIVPGSPGKLDIETSVDPLFTEVAGRLVAFQEDLVDLAAQRRRLEILRENVLKKAVDQNDLTAVRQLTDRLNALPHRPELSEKLEMIKTEIEGRSASLGQPRLGAEVRRLFLQCEALLEQQVPLNPEVIDASTVPADSPAPPTPEPSP